MFLGNGLNVEEAVSIVRVEKLLILFNIASVRAKKCRYTAIIRANKCIFATDIRANKCNDTTNTRANKCRYEEKYFIKAH